MKIINLKRKNNNKVYFKIDESEEKIITFDELKELSKDILLDSINDGDLDYQINCETNDLELYKETLESLIESIKSDSDLITLYKEVNNIGSAEISSIENSDE